MTTKTRRQYTEEFKREAVKLITEQGYKVSEAARNLGINVGLLGRWKREFQAQASSQALHPEERAELRRLREETRRLRMAREILKKAAAFFAKESDHKGRLIDEPTK